MTRMKFALLLLAALLIPGFAQAAPITYILDDCDDQGCDGASFRITIEDIGNDMTLVDYTVITDGTQSFLGMNQIGYLAVTNWDTAELLSAPNGLSEWSDPFSSPVNANSTCSNVNPNQNKKACIYGFVDTSTNPGEYTWEFKFTGGTIVGEEDIKFSGQWADGPAPSSGQIISASLPGASVPEPSSALVFGLGALLISRSLKRR